jgi:hypothetical protein
VIGKAQSGDIEGFSKLCKISPAYLASILDNCPPEEEEETPEDAE